MANNPQANIEPVSVRPELLTTALAYDVASKLITLDDIRTKYELSAAQLRKLTATPEFRKLYKEAKVLWESDPEARIRAKAQAAVEDGLLPVHSILHNTEFAPLARMEAFKQLSNLANMGPKRDESTAGGRVSITINVPSTQHPTVINGDKLISIDE